MCELFGASSSQAVSLSRWLAPFCARGGATAENRDGWGLAAWSAGMLQLEKSPEPGATSERFGHLAQHLRGEIVIAHVRKARHPPVPGMLDTHPFSHACCGREWVFAHNGMVPKVIEWPSAGSVCRPLGETDSEFAFCHLLTAIAESYDHAERGEQGTWLGRLAGLAGVIAALGKFNFLLSDGRVLIAYGHDRLHHLEFDDAQGRHAIIATEALTDDVWQPFSPGELRVYRDGRMVLRAIGGREFDDAGVAAQLRELRA